MRQRRQVVAQPPQPGQRQQQPDRVQGQPGDQGGGAPPVRQVGPGVDPAGPERDQREQERLEDDEPFAARVLPSWRARGLGGHTRFSW